MKAISLLKKSRSLRSVFIRELQLARGDTARTNKIAEFVE